MISISDEMAKKIKIRLYELDKNQVQFADELGLPLWKLSKILNRLCSYPAGFENRVAAVFAKWEKEREAIKKICR